MDLIKFIIIILNIKKENIKIIIITHYLLSYTICIKTTLENLNIINN